MNIIDDNIHYKSNNKLVIEIDYRSFWKRVWLHYYKFMILILLATIIFCIYELVKFHYIDIYILSLILLLPIAFIIQFIINLYIIKRIEIDKMSYSLILFIYKRDNFHRIFNLNINDVKIYILKIFYTGGGGLYKMEFQSSGKKIFSQKENIDLTRDQMKQIKEKIFEYLDMINL